MLIDTHAHLYWEDYKQDLDEVIQRCLNAGVTTIINVGVDVELSKKAVEQIKFLERSSQALIKAYSTIGIHPHEALRYTQGKLDPSVSIHHDIRELGKIYLENRSKCIAVGECGLDYLFRELDSTLITQDDNKTIQKQLFQAQIELAKKLNLPLIVHCRDDRSQNPQNSEAWEEVLEMIGDHPTILHCYSGLEQTTKRVLEKPSILVSFAATITYPKNDYLREAAKILPLEKIVLETDCPFLPPQSKRGQRNEPSSVLEIAQLIAEIKGVSLEKIADQTTANVSQLFAF